MAIWVGGTEPSKFYVGGTEVSRIYRGSDLVWEPAAAGPGLLLDAVSCSEYDGVTVSSTVGGVSRFNRLGFGPPSGDTNMVNNPTGDQDPIALPVGATQFRAEYACGRGSVVPNSRIQIFMDGAAAGGPLIGEWYFPAVTGSWGTYVWGAATALTTPVPSGYDSFHLVFEADNFNDMANLLSIEFVA